MRSDFISRQNLGSTVVLTLNRPEKRNALNLPLLLDLLQHLKNLRETNYSTVVLTSTGDVFSAGQDLIDPPPLELFSDILHLIDTFPIPTITALNGHAFGGGAGLFVATDLAVASDAAKIGFPEVRRGLLPAIVMPYLLRRIPSRRVSELLLTGEPISARTARAWGLVNRVVSGQSCLITALEYANRVSRGGPMALRGTKHLLSDLSSGASISRELLASFSNDVRTSPEALEGLAAFSEKRKPRWPFPHWVNLPGVDFKSLTKGDTDTPD